VINVETLGFIGHPFGMISGNSWWHRTGKSALRSAFLTPPCVLPQFIFLLTPEAEWIYFQRNSGTQTSGDFGGTR